MRGLKHVLEYTPVNIPQSHLLQMRGLKLIMSVLILLMSVVASFTDAWIETFENAPELGKEFSRIFYRCVD